MIQAAEKEADERRVAENKTDDGKACRLVTPR